MWRKDLADEIIAEEFSPPDLELAWLDEDEGDPKGMEAVLEGRVKLGAVTLNELRDGLGLDPYANPAAARPMVLTATGYVPIEAALSSPAGLTRGSMLPRRYVDRRAELGNDASLQKYSPDQPRVPAGNTDGGQWTSEGGGIGAPGDLLSDASVTPQHSTETGPQYAALETGTRTDVSSAPAGVQYAGATEDDENENRAGPQFEGTPAQLLRQEIAEREYQSALSQVLRLDPTWKPSPSLIDPNDIEGDITRLEAWTEEAKEYFGRLRDLAKPLDHNTGDSISPSMTKTGDLFVDWQPKS